MRKVGVLTWNQRLLGTLTVIGWASVLLLVWRLAGHTYRLARWECLPAVYQQWTGNRSVEVEAIRQGVPVRFHVAVSPSVLYRAVDSISIALDPSDPTRAVAMDFANLWRRLLNPLCFLVVAWIAHLNLARVNWGQDRTWSEGAWLPTPPGEIAASTDSKAVVLRETRSVQRYQIFVLGLFAACALGSAYGVVRGDSLFATLGFVLSTGVTFVLAGILVSSRTRRLVVSDEGLRDVSFFGTQRVPWSEMREIRRRNLNEKAQRDYARSDITPFQKGASRPTTVYVDFIVDAKGREILALPDRMEPEDAFRSLRERIDRGTNGRAARRG